MNRPGTGIGRWTTNFLSAHKELAPEVEVLGIGSWADGVTRAIKAPSFGWTGLTLNKALQNEDVGLFLSPYYKIPPGLKIPVFHTVHDTIPYRIPHRKVFFNLRLALAAKNAARTVTVSEHSRDELVDSFGISEEKILLAKNGVAASFSPVPGKRDEDILDRIGVTSKRFYLAVIDERPHKNLSTLVKAFEHRDMEPVIVVGGGLRPLPSPFRSETYLDDDVLSALYRHARALLHPALEEGFGLPVLEALASGTPAIVSDIHVMREVAGSAAHYVAPLVPEDWRRALDEMEIDSETCLAQAEHFRPAETYRELWGAIREALSS